MGLRAFFYRHERWMILLYLSCLLLVSALFIYWLTHDRGYYTLEKLIIKRYREPWEVRYERAASIREAGDLPAAETAYERFLEALPADQLRLTLSPLKVKALRDLGSIYLQRGKRRRALETYRELAAFDPRNYHSYYHLADCHAARGETDEALGALHEALRINPNYQAAFEKAVELLHEAGRYEEALRRYGEYDNALCLATAIVYFSDGRDFSHERRALVRHAHVDGKPHTYVIPLYGNDGWYAQGTVTGLRLGILKPAQAAFYVVKIGGIELVGPSRPGERTAAPVASFSGDFRNWEVDGDAEFLSPDVVRLAGEGTFFTTATAVDPQHVDAIEVDLTIYKPVSWETVLTLADCYRWLNLLREEEEFLERMRDQFPERPADPFTPEFLLRRDGADEGGGET